MIKTLLPYVHKNRLYSLLTPLIIIFEVLIEVSLPALMSIIVDCGIYNKPLDEVENLLLIRVFTNTGIISGSGFDLVMRTGLLMVILAIISLTLGASASRFAAKAGMGFGADVRQGIFDRVQNFSFSNIDSFSTSSLITRMTTDVNMLQMTYMMSIRLLVRAPFMFIMAIYYSMKINASLSLVFIVITPILTGVALLIGSKALPRFRRMFEKYDKFNASVQENLTSIRVVKSFVRSIFEKKKFAFSNDALRDAAIHAEKLIVFAMPLMMLAMYSAIVAILWFGGNQVVAGSMGTGELISFITYVGQIMSALMLISMIFVMIVMSRAAASRVSEVLSTASDINDDSANPSLKITKGKIEFSNVSFKYKKAAKNEALSNISLSIREGETIGIIGGTGSAKTTLVQLIPRLYDVSSGELKIDGHNVKEYPIKALRESIAMVLQNNLLFSGTIQENLKWGNENASLEEIKQACKIADADNFIESFPDGYNTYLGQAGVNVSGGQKQRICIARALLKKPAILILDDSTSAVDTATDARIREGLKKMLRDTTTIIIAQRIASVKDADRIVVLEDGKINGIGTHEDLLKTNEIYADVHNSQIEGRAL